jgi:hypothetical protein
MMGRKAARNMYSSKTSQIGIQCICWFYSQGIETLLGIELLTTPVFVKVETSHFTVT